MKKKGIILAVLSILAGSGILAYGQEEKYVPLTTWPYVYEDFLPGRIKTYQGGDIAYDKLNVNLVNGRAHFVKDGKIMEADMKTIALMTIGEDSYVCASGKMVKVVKNTLHSAVVLSTTVDTEAMSKADIGYGKSSTASTQGVSLTAISGDMDYSVNRSLDDLSSKRKTGEKLVLKNVTGIYYRGSFVPATKIDILNIPGIDKEAVKDFIKREKIKFKNADDLGRLVDFMYSL